MALAILHTGRGTPEGETMKTKEKTRQPAKNSAQETKPIYTRMKTSDMAAIDQKIHDLLIAEGYFYLRASKFEGAESNNYRNVNRLEYMGGGELITVITTHCMKPK